MFKYFNLEKTYQYLLIMLAFFLPITVFGANLMVVIICILWLFSGNYKSKFHEILNNKLMLASLIFFSLHVVGLLWSEDLIWGLHITHKMWYFLLLFPVLFTIVKKDFIKYYISAFLMAISITEVLSYLIWFEIIPPFKSATLYDPTPFMDHTAYNPFLAFAIYLVLHQTFFNNKLKKLEVILYSFFSISMTINMFITGGRAGQIMFFAVLAILIFQYFKSQKFKAIVVLLIVSSTIFFTAYQSSNIFQHRTDSAIHNIQNYGTSLIYKNSSIGLRITFLINSWELIKEHPILGVGTGDFPSEYSKINSTKSPGVLDTSNPHNMYLLVLTQLGIVGLVSFLSIFYYQIKWSYLSENKFIRDVGIALPLLYLLIMLSDSYLLGHYTSLLYIFFSAFLYKNFDKP